MVIRTFNGSEPECYEFTGRLPTEEEVMSFNTTYALSLTDCDIDTFEPFVEYAAKHSKLCCGLILDNCRVRDWKSVQDLSLWEFQTCETGLTDLSVIGDAVHGFNDLVFRGENITDISPLSKLFQPQRISIHQAYDLTDISALKGKTTLKTVEFIGCDIRDISPLEGLSQLQRIVFCLSKKLTDISALRGMSELRYADFDYCNISDLSPLEGLPNLDRLRLNKNPISDFSVLRTLPKLKFLKWKSDDESSTACNTLSGLTQLQTLFTGGRAVKNLDFIRGMTSLLWLSLTACNECCDLSLLAECKNLRHLSIGDCNISNTSFLYEMPWLERLSLDRRALGEEEARRLTEAYPEGVVFFYGE